MHVTLKTLVGEYVITTPAVAILETTNKQSAHTELDPELENDELLPCFWRF